MVARPTRPTRYDDRAVPLPLGREHTSPRRTSFEPGHTWCLDLVQGLHAIVWELDVTTMRFVFVSEGAERVLGYPLDRWYDEAGFWETVVIHPDDRDAVIDLRWRATLALRDHRVSYRARAADGRVVPLTEDVRVVADAHRQPRSLRGVSVASSTVADWAPLSDLERQRAALRASATGTFRWDLRDDTLEWDATARALLGFRVTSRVADVQTADDLLVRVHPDDRARVLTSVWQCHEGAHDLREEFRLVLDDGAVRRVLVSARTFVGDDAQPVYLTGALVDVTDVRRATGASARQAEEARDQALAELQRSNRELDQFANVVSHDLKAPLRGIANLAQWIDEDAAGTLSDTARGHLRLLHGRVRRMAGLIDGILSYARAAQVRAEPTPVDLGALVGEVIELLGPPPGIAFDVAPDFPTIVAERVPLQQVVMNLVANAVKHGRADAPRIEVGWRDAGREIECWVRDNGPGIAPEFHERVWGIFQTLAARDTVEGSGIGLAVVRRIVESRGARAWVVSTPGAGATFYFTWPTSPSSPPSEAP